MSVVVFVDYLLELELLVFCNRIFEVVTVIHVFLCCRCCTTRFFDKIRFKRSNVVRQAKKCHVTRCILNENNTSYHDMQECM